MPIKLIPPRKEAGQANFYGRGTYLGVFVNKSTGVAGKQLAARIIKKWEQDIERGVFGAAQGETFMSAAVRYMEKGGERRFVARLIAYFGPDRLLRPALPQGETIDGYWQREIDNAAAALMPTQSAASRNREIYTPASAILKVGKVKFTFERPKGSRGRELVGWLRKEQAEALLRAAYGLDTEFGLLCHTLLFTGLRLVEGTRRLTCDNLNLQEGWALIPRTKNGKPRTVFLPEHLVAALANHPRGLDRGADPVFRFHKSGHLYKLLDMAATRAGVVLPERQAFHIFRHTYGATMKRIGADLVGTGAWLSKQSAQRYEHLDMREEAQKAALLPAPTIKIGR
jgi:integrase